MADTTTPPPRQPPELTKAIQLHKHGDAQESRDQLRDFLVQQPGNVDALLWLARVTDDLQEALAAADLALKLDPRNEIAQRAVATVRQRDDNACQSSRTTLTSAASVATGMTLSQALNANWPFRSINRPIGELLDAGTITLRDLGWAAENAYDDRVKDAARTVLLYRLLDVEPTEKPKLLRVVEGSRYTEREERKAVLWVGLLTGMAFLFLMGLMIGAILQILGGAPAWVALVVFGCLAGAALLTWGAEHFLDSFESRKKGRLGEERVVEELRYALDGQWTLYRNLEWPGRKAGDIDLVLVGPGGIWAFEVKAYSTPVRIQGDQWESNGKWRRRRRRRSPIQQAKRNAANLRDYLEMHGVNVRWVEPVVVWAGDGKLAVRDPSIRVWTLDELPECAETLLESSRLSKDTIEQATAMLDALCQELRAQRNTNERSKK